MNYFDILNESFDKTLLEAKQDEINFANVFGTELKDRFKAQKQRMSSPENDFYYWIKLSKEDLNGTIEKLDAFISGLENKATRSQKSKLASEGADIVYEDDEWIVLKINTYEAAAKYGAGTTWCITGRYPGHEGRGEEYFNDYRENNGWDFYFFIVKDGRDLEGHQEKYCLCWNGDPDDTEYEVYNMEDNEIGYIPNAPTIEGFPQNLGVEVNRDDEYDEYDDAPAEPVRPNAHPSVEMIPVDDPNDFEFPSNSLEDAAKQFKSDAEVVETVRDPDLHIVKWHEEPLARPEDAADDFVDDTGDRYSLFVFIPGEGGGPLLAQTGNGFALEVFKTLEACKRKANSMPGVEIRNNAQDIDAENMPECLKENFYYYDDGSWYYDL